MFIFPKFVQMSLYFGGCIYRRGRLIFVMLIKFHIWEHIIKGNLYTGGIFTEFYSIGYGREFHHFMKSFGSSKGKENGKIRHKKETEILVHNI